MYLYVFSVTRDEVVGGSNVDKANDDRTVPLVYASWSSLFTIKEYLGSKFLKHGMESNSFMIQRRMSISIRKSVPTHWSCPVLPLCLPVQVWARVLPVPPHPVGGSMYSLCWSFIHQ